MKQAVEKWDLANPKDTDVLDFALVKDPELAELKEHFSADKLTRQLRAIEVKESLDKGFSLEEVLNYPRHLPTSTRTIFGVKSLLKRILLHSSCGCRGRKTPPPQTPPMRAKNGYLGA
ncbi:hypothetical protein NHP190003_08170 [Helicobacter sp. NHP19-003]|uniref:Uncharacterized protein n=1 Tax=Helicobacter gastrocanis TaxID=2849641 RepID=A0ABM7SAC2_9HELI|nr:hypothetical protein [Helicobacter sp. NHP19-003]BCZ17535.1 hypothetical protein NHP190003_08170 [Helicobacter sp. NHP19-003]